MTPEKRLKIEVKRSLLNNWDSDANVARAIEEALRVCGMQFGPDGCQAVRDCGLPLHKPQYQANTHRFIAAHFPRVSDALWDGMPRAEVWRLFLKTPYIAGHSPLKQAYQQSYIEGQSVRFIRARSLSKWHDWQTVK